MIYYSIYNEFNISCHNWSRIQWIIKSIAKMHQSVDRFNICLKSILCERIKYNIIIRGLDCTSKNIINALNIMVDWLNKNAGVKGIIYYAGHGNHIGWNNTQKDQYSNMKEYWQTSAGSINENLLASTFHKANEKSVLILFSESCSSEHMINNTICHKHWISIGATQDGEDAIVDEMEAS